MHYVETRFVTSVLIVCLWSSVSLFPFVNISRIFLRNTKKTISPPAKLAFCQDRKKKMMIWWCHNKPIICFRTRHQTNLRKWINTGNLVARHEINEKWQRLHKYEITKKSLFFYQPSSVVPSSISLKKSYNRCFFGVVHTTDIVITKDLRSSTQQNIMLRAASHYYAHYTGTAAVIIISV